MPNIGVGTALSIMSAKFSHSDSEGPLHAHMCMYVASVPRPSLLRVIKNRGRPGMKYHVRDDA